MAPTILSVRDVRKAFGNLQALDGVSIDVEERKVSILVGPNGSGKTTLINIISGLYRPDSGTVLFQAKNIEGFPPFKLYDMGIARTFQIPALFWKLTVLENLLVAERKNPGESFMKSLRIVGLKSWQDFVRPWRETASGWQLIHGFQSLKAIITKHRFRQSLHWAQLMEFMETVSNSLLKPWSVFFTPAWLENEERAAKKASRILELLGLSRFWNKPAYLLSGGQMKLVEIGRALMTDARVLLLDEPVSGVNPTLAHEIFSRILRLRDEFGLTFFIVEHRLDIALKYVDHMFAMALGRVVASGPPQEVLNNPQVVESYLGA